MFVNVNSFNGDTTVTKLQNIHTSFCVIRMIPDQFHNRSVRDEKPDIRVA